MANVDAARRRLPQAIAELTDLAGEFLPPPLVRHLQEARDRLAAARFNLVVLGEFKRGKSTLINALLGQEILPTDVVPLTSAVTIIRHGPGPRLLVRFQDGREEEHASSELHRFATERGNPENRLGVDSTIVEIPAGLLATGMQLVDTPGIGSVYEHNSAAAREFLPRVDVAICVLAADQPLAQSERELFVDIADRVPRLLVVVNKIDHLRDEERGVAVQFIEDAVGELLAVSDVEVCAVSAREGEGVTRLAQRIARLAEDERETLLRRSVARLAADAAADAAQGVRFERRAIELPLEELRRRASAFQQRIVPLREATSEAIDLLERRVESVLGAVNEPLSTLAHRESPRLRAQLVAQAATLERLSARELAPALDAWIDETVRRRFDELAAQLQDSVGAEVRVLQQHFAERIEKILVELQDVAEEVFGARATEWLPTFELSETTRFTFKLEPEFRSS